MHGDYRMDEANFLKAFFWLNVPSLLGLNCYQIIWYNPRGSLDVIKMVLELLITSAWTIGWGGERCLWG